MAKKAEKVEYEVVMMAVDDIKPSKDNPRKTFDADDLEALKGSIEERGLTEPILVRRADGTIIKGERRYRAEKLAGAKTLPVRVYDVDELTAGEMRLQGEAATPSREYEDGLARQYKEGKKAGRYASMRHFSKIIGQPKSTVTEILTAHDARMDVSGHDVFQEASYIDIFETEKLAKKDPEARIDLLKQVENTTVLERREIAKVAEQTSDQDLRRKIAKREISVEDAKTTEVLEAIAPKERRTLLDLVSTGAIDSKELTARVEALQEAPADIRELVVSGELAPDVARTISKLPTPASRKKFVDEVQLIKDDQERTLKKHTHEIERAAEDEVHGRPPEPTAADIKRDIARVEYDNWMQGILNKLHTDTLAAVRTDFLEKISEEQKRQQCYWYIEDIANICQRILAERTLVVQMIEEGV